MTSNDSKAGLLLHEAIYRYAILKQNAENSDGVRFFNYIIGTNAIDLLELSQLDQYITFLKESHLFIENDCIKKGPVFVRDDGSFSSNVCYNYSLNYGNLNILIPANSILRNESPIYFDLPFDRNYKTDSVFFEVEIYNPNGLNVHFKTRQIYIEKFTNGTFFQAKVSEIINGGLPQMMGPLSKSYECTDFKMNVYMNELVECETKGSDFFRFFRKTDKGDRWILGYAQYLNTLKANVKLPVLGSKKGLAYSLSYDSFKKTLPRTPLEFEKADSSPR